MVQTLEIVSTEYIGPYYWGHSRTNMNEVAKFMKVRDSKDLFITI